MELSEKIYNLRKQHGLSQEQLAEQLQVSRQAVSKWETGQSTPDSTKLVALSELFSVSTEYLLKPEAMPSQPETTPESRRPNRAGLMICLVGLVMLIFWGLVAVFQRELSGQISESSVIQLDGNGIFLLASLSTMGMGAWLLLKDKT